MTNFDPQQHREPSDEQYSAAQQYPADQQYAGYHPYPDYTQYTGYTDAQYPNYAYPANYGYQPTPPPAPIRPGRRRALLGVGAAALAVALVGGGVVVGRASQSSTPVAQQPSVGNESSTQNGSGFGSGSGNGSGNGSDGGFGSGQGLTPNQLFPNEQSPGGTQNGSGSGSSGRTGTAASSTQQRGIVTIVSTLKYQNAQSAGTGMIISSDGEILTNNHVINGATSVRVTDETTGRSYTADVVGTAPTKDVAVLQLRNATGLTTAKTGDAGDVSNLKVGDAVAGVGNAGGTGSLTVATGKVTALEQSITASDEGGGNSEQLTGLIQVDAAIVSGDSGGPLYDADGDIVGIDTAASSSNGSGSGTNEGYAVPIDDAMKIADQIESGVETSSVHIGLPGFIGVGVADTNGQGAGISSVLEGGPAADAGITQGSVVTAVDGKPIADGDALKTALASLDPGKTVSVTWTDTSGESHTGKVTLATGPAD